MKLVRTRQIRRWWGSGEADFSWASPKTARPVVSIVDRERRVLYAMATPRREPHSDVRTNRAARNMSPVLKPTESDQGFRWTRSVPSSPDRKLSPSLASNSSNPCRPSSSFNARTASSRSTSGSASSSIHCKTLHSSSSMTMRGKGDKSGGTSLWPPATHSPSSKDMTRRAKSPSILQKSKLSSRAGVEKMTLSSSFTKLRTQKGISGAMVDGKTQDVSTARTPGATAKRKMDPFQRTKSVPARPVEAPKVEEQEVELLMEFDEMESISTPSIEEHLQERLPDPVELKYVDIIAYVTSQDDPSKPSCNQQEEKNDEVMEVISGEQHQAKENEEENADAGINETLHDTEPKEAVVEPTLIVKEEKVMPPKKALELVQGWRKDDERSSEVKEEGRSRPVEERKSKVMALIGRFETAMSGRE